MSEVVVFLGLTSLGAGTVIIALLLWAAFNPEKTLKWASFLQGLFVNISSRARKGTISSRIRANILKANKRIKNVDSDILPDDLRIEWTKDETTEAFLDENRVIVRMNNKDHPHKNFVTAVSGYVSEGLLTKYRKYIDREILRAADLSMMRKIILNGYDSAVDYFDTSIVEPILASQPELEPLISDIRTIDCNGMFVGILLKEYAKASRVLYPQPADECLMHETRELLTFLHSIACGNARAPEELIFSSVYFSLDVFLAAKDETLDRLGDQNYIRIISKALQTNVRTVYVFGLGKKVQLVESFIGQVKEIANIDDDDVHYHYYNHRSLERGKICEGLCVELNSNREIA